MISEYHQRQYEQLDNALTRVGTGKGPLNGGLEALAKGPVRLHNELDDDPQAMTLILDGESWTELADRSTGFELSLRLRCLDRRLMFGSSSHLL